MQEQLSFELRVCTRCKEAKPLDAFSKRARSRDGLMEACKACKRIEYERTKDERRPHRLRYYAKNRERIRAQQRKMNRHTHLHSRYRITVEEWEAIFDSQGRVCAICGTDTPIRHWHTDHCHDTKKVRAILCQRCNVGLGLFDDDTQRLRQAYEYLLRHHAPQPPGDNERSPSHMEEA